MQTLPSLAVLPALGIGMVAFRFRLYVLKIPISSPLLRTALLLQLASSIMGWVAALCIMWDEAVWQFVVSSLRTLFAWSTFTYLSNKSPMTRSQVVGLVFMLGTNLLWELQHRLMYLHHVATACVNQTA